MSISDEVKRLHELHQAGALSDAEFEQAKARLFATPSPSLEERTDFANMRRSRSDRWLGGVCGGLAV
ncbi:MAG TPA: PspC domain-containing protein, partial [Telluria sp.]